jgi:hypothetical protein
MARPLERKLGKRPSDRATKPRPTNMRPLGLKFCWQVDTGIKAWISCQQVLDAHDLTSLNVICLATKELPVATFAGNEKNRPIHREDMNANEGDRGWMGSFYHCCLTPKLSGAPQQNDWQFIHGASARTQVGRPNHRKASGTRCSFHQSGWHLTSATRAWAQRTADNWGI